MIERLVISIKGPLIDMEDVMKQINIDEDVPMISSEFMKISINRNFRDIERDVLLKSLELYNGDHSKTAKALGISRTTIWRKTQDQ